MVKIAGLAGLVASSPIYSLAKEDVSDSHGPVIYDESDRPRSPTLALGAGFKVVALASLESLF